MSKRAEHPCLGTTIPFRRCSELGIPSILLYATCGSERPGGGIPLGITRFTALAKSFYRLLKRNYVVQVLVRVAGVGKNGSQYEVQYTLPVAKLCVERAQLPRTLTAAQLTSE